MRVLFVIVAIFQWKKTWPPPPPAYIFFKYRRNSKFIRAILKYKSNGRVSAKTKINMENEYDYFHFIILFIFYYFVNYIAKFCYIVGFFWSQGHYLLKLKVCHINLINNSCSFHCYRTIYCWTGQNCMYRGNWKQ